MAKRFPAASHGLKQIFTSEILMIIGSVFSGIALALIGFNGMDTANFNTDNPAIIPIAVFACVGVILYLMAAIMQLMGIHNAGKDSKRFRNAFSFILLALAVSIVASVMTSGWPDVFGSKFEVLSEGVVNVLELVSAYFIMTGIRDLAIGAGKPKIATFASRIWNVYCVVIIASALISLLSLANVDTTILGVISLITIILATVADIAYLVLLYRAKKAIR